MLRLRFLLNIKMKIAGRQWICEYEVLKKRSGLKIGLLVIGIQMAFVDKEKGVQEQVCGTPDL